MRGHTHAGVFELRESGALTQDLQALGGGLSVGQDWAEETVLEGRDHRGQQGGPQAEVRAGPWKGQVGVIEQEVGTWQGSQLSAVCIVGNPPSGASGVQGKARGHPKLDQSCG